jgi:hypothetical protein
MEFTHMVWGLHDHVDSYHRLLGYDAMNQNCVMTHVLVIQLKCNRVMTQYASNHILLAKSNVLQIMAQVSITKGHLYECVAMVFKECNSLKYQNMVPRMSKLRPQRDMQITPLTTKQSTLLTQILSDNTRNKNNKMQHQNNIYCETG